VVDIYGETLILHPEKSQPFWPMVVSKEQAETLHQLRDSINRTKQRLREFENRYGVTSDHFLREMTAEDLHDGDLEYVEWAGEASLLDGLEGELRELQDAYYKLIHNPLLFKKGRLQLLR